jgi:hypothetical protein
MAPRNYWLDLFTYETWQEFLAAGGDVSGFRQAKWKTVQQIKPGDFLMCYLTGVSRFIGVLQVESQAFQDTKLIWGREPFPARVRVRIVVQLTPETAVPVLELREVLSIFRGDQESRGYWTGFVRSSPSKWKETDGEAVVKAIQAAKTNPIERPFDPAKLAYRPKGFPSKLGTVTVPGPEPQPSTTAPEKETNAHLEIQWLLAKLGNDMGLDVWVARNDRNREYGGKKFSDLPRLKADLPIQFDDATNNTIELIDVLWLQKHSIVAAFEIESTTSIYSGLLRMSDLISMQPNLNIPLFIVAPDERRDKVVAEVNRPTFSKLTPPMYEVCRFLPFSTLRTEVSHVGKYVQHLKSDFIEELAESCEIEET